MSRLQFFLRWAAGAPALVALLGLSLRTYLGRVCEASLAGVPWVQLLGHWAPVPPASLNTAAPCAISPPTSNVKSSRCSTSSPTLFAKPVKMKNDQITFKFVLPQSLRVGICLYVIGHSVCLSFGSIFLPISLWGHLLIYCNSLHIWILILYHLCML